MTRSWMSRRHRNRFRTNYHNQSGPVGLLASMIVIAAFVAMVLGPIILVANSSGPVAGLVTVPPSALYPLPHSEIVLDRGSQVASGVIPCVTEVGE
jgi:hypothetical protein